MARLRPNSVLLAAGDTSVGFPPMGFSSGQAVRSRNLLELQNHLLRRLTASQQTFTTEREAKNALRETLKAQAVLVILDDVWTVDHADAFCVTVPPARLLITTRNAEVVVGLGAEEHGVNVLSSGDSLTLLAGWAGKLDPNELPPQATEIANDVVACLWPWRSMARLRPGGWDDALTLETKECSFGRRREQLS